MIRAGELVHTITIEEPPISQTASGEPSGEWSQFATRRAAIVPRTGREFPSLMQIAAEMTLALKCRGRMAVTTDMRVVFDGRRFDILVAYSPDGKSPENAQELVLLCREGLSQGS